MSTVTVTFVVEADDPDHSTGLTNDRYDEIVDAVAELGAENAPEFTKNGD